MTVVAALREADDALLIAADSGVTHWPGPIRDQYHSKLQRHPTAPLAWVGSGNPYVTIEGFAPWARTYPWPPRDWDTFAQRAAGELARLNGRQRRLAERARAKDENGTGEILLVGWLSTPEIFEFDDHGRITSAREDGFHAMGSGGEHVRVLYRLLERLPGPAVPPLERLAWSMEISAGTVEGCELPVYIWRITRAEVVPVTDWRPLLAARKARLQPSTPWLPALSEPRTTPLLNG